METKMQVQKKPIDYLRIVFKKKWLIITPVFIGIVISIVAATTLPKVYSASTLILIEEGRVINPLIEGLAVSTSIAQRLVILREQMLGWDRLNQLISNLGLATNVRNEKDFEDLVKRLRRDIRVKLHGHNIVRISYEGADPLKAMNIVKTITDIFINENVKFQTRETDNAIGFINDQLELYKKKLKEGEISVMVEKLDGLLIDSTSKHPIVIDLRKKIQTAKDELEAGNYEVDATEESDVEVAALRKELTGLREELISPNSGASKDGANTRLSAATDEKLYKLLLLERIGNVTRHDMGVNQTLYNELLKRLETAKITQRLEASKEGTRYSIIDPARLPLKPIKPNKMLILFMGIFFGLCAGLGLVFLAEVFDHSFLGVDDAKVSLKHPMLGAISKIVTQADVAASRAHNTRAAGISVLIGVILVIFIIYNILL